MEESKITPVGRYVSVMLMDAYGNENEIIKSHVEKMTAHVIYLIDHKTQKRQWIGWGPGMIMTEFK